MRPLRIHATNLTGMGSRRLAESLLPSLLDHTEGPVELFLAPGDTLDLIAHSRGKDVKRIHRRLPNALSRFAEVTLASHQFLGQGDILVLGDMPLARIENQTVLVHNSFLLEGAVPKGLLNRAKFKIARATFSMTQRWARRFIVQTESMRQGLMDTYGIDNERISVIGQPPPEAICTLRTSCSARKIRTGDAPIKLFYPSRRYPHKRHDRLKTELLESLSDVVSRIVLTVEPIAKKGRHHPMLEFIGEVDIERIAREYGSTDALLFLSDAESYGLPLLEAVWLDLPVVCPDLPYARDILGENPFFFAPESDESLSAAIRRLHSMLAQGWRADWSERRRLFPENWSQVAERFLTEIRPRQPIKDKID